MQSPSVTIQTALGSVFDDLTPLVSIELLAWQRARHHSER